MRLEAERRELGRTGLERLEDVDVNASPVPQADTGQMPSAGQDAPAAAEAAESAPPAEPAAEVPADAAATAGWRSPDRSSRMATRSRLRR